MVGKLQMVVASSYGRKAYLESISKYKEVYDESLHWPKILVLTSKGHDMIEEDRLGFIAQQKARPPSLVVRYHSTEDN
jgi:hypothetical protein